MTDDEERQLRQELLVSDLNLRRKQDFWESPRNLAIIVAATAAIFSAVAGLAGYKFGQTPQVIINLPPQRWTKLPCILITWQRRVNRAELAFWLAIRERQRPDVDFACPRII